MSKIKTAKEFLEDAPFNGEYWENLLIRFAKLHVEAFRKEVSENVSLIKECGKENSLNCNAVFCRSCLDIINKDSILNAYPLTLIK